jgi:amino-acid N-acetyltransferase
MQDIPAMVHVVNGYAEQAIMLPRNEMEMAESIRDFSVAEIDGEFAGCGALHFYTPIAGEVRSLAVPPERKGMGVGRSLVEALEAEARLCDLATLFAFTYVPGFFGRLGYERVSRDLLPLKAWKDCLRCPKFQCCDEIAVLKKLKDVPLKLQLGQGAGVSELVELPVLKT